MKGHVFIVGAGPGNPGLLTLRGQECLRRADVVIYDTIVSSRILDLARPNILKIAVGAKSSAHSADPGQVNPLVLRHASRGKIVVRLKGGDPFLLSRGDEEALYLQENRIPFEIVPGVSTASACAAFAGIPLTDYQLASMVTIVNGHESDDKKEASVEWSRISRQSTLVIYMGLDHLGLITERLMRHNWRSDTPVAIIQWASTPAQRVVEGTLSSITADVEKAGITCPALIVVGKVVSLRKKLSWFDTRPLSGKRVVITRAADQAAEFAVLLEEMGAETILFPTIQILPPSSWTPFDNAIRNLVQFDWILFSSVHGVKGFFARLQQIGGDTRDLHGIRLGAIGPKTAWQLTQRGLKIDAFPEDFNGKALADIVSKSDSCHVLFAAAEEPREVIQKTLEQKGATVVVAPVYRTVKARGIRKELKNRLLNGEADVVTFTSPSTVDGFMRHFTSRQRKKIFAQSKAAVIGPVTAEALKEYGIRPAIRPSKSTIEALALEIEKHMK